MSNEKTSDKTEATYGKDIEWLIEGMLPIGHKGMIACPEGSCKTTLECWLAVCVATGHDIFGMHTRQGHVIMIDEETPIGVLELKIHRFCLGLGLKSRQDIPNLHVLSMREFRFGRTNTDILALIKEFKPTLITIDSVLACLPSGRQGLEENNAKTGIAIREDLNKILDISPDTSMMLAAHSGKPITNYDVEDFQKAEMQELVRGHGSIVGEACDTGFGIKKLTDKPVLRFVVIPKPRRTAIFMETTYVEMKEEDYGKGRAVLEKIKPIPAPPSEVASDLYTLIPGDGSAINAQKIKQQASAMYSPSEIRLGLLQLKRRKVIVNEADAFTFKLNPKTKEIDFRYLQALDMAQAQCQSQACTVIE
jgi:hypothetical protein